jgi:hypothetical protein
METTNEETALLNPSQSGAHHEASALRRGFVAVLAVCGVLAVTTTTNRVTQGSTAAEMEAQTSLEGTATLEDDSVSAMVDALCNQYDDDLYYPIAYECGAFLIFC